MGQNAGMTSPESLGGATPDRFARAARTKRERSGLAVLDAAERLFERDGYAATTVAAIAEEAGVGLATLYSHHPTKAALADELFRRCLEADAAQMTDPPEAARTPAQRLRSELVLLARTAARVPGVAEAVLQSVSGPPTRAERSKEAHGGRGRIPIEADIADTLRAGQATGGFRRDFEADELARIIVTALLDRVVARPDDDPERVAERILSLFTVGITGK